VGPLKGIRVIEMAGIGPGPFCGMLLADMGADVLRIDRAAVADPGVAFPTKFDLLNRNKRSVVVDLKSPQGLATLRQLLLKADALIEGFRPGVMERLGLGPQPCLALNPRLIYGRMTGWGQDGPMSQAAGHDLNYIALSGVLHTIGQEGQAPSIPLNVVGDFGGGALYLAMGMLAAIIEARTSGAGQVVDAAMVDGVTSLMTMHYAMMQIGELTPGRGRNVLDGGSHFYNVYATKDGRFVSVAAIEGRFYSDLLKRLGLNESELPLQHDRESWGMMHERFTAIFKSRTRDEWCALLEGTDACFAPVLDPGECATHPHHVARQVFAEMDGVMHPQPAPRFSRTPSALKNPPPVAGADTVPALIDWGFSRADIDALKEAGAIS
jgi:alpha-methylacyl-CoA racemase